MIDEVEFSEVVARSLRQAAAFDKAFPPGSVDDATGERCIPRELADVMLLAMRFSATRAGAPARCRRKVCRSGQCHMIIEPNGDGVCQGGINEAVVDNAAMVLAFMMKVVGHYLGGDRR